MMTTCGCQGNLDRTLLQGMRIAQLGTHEHATETRSLRRGQTLSALTTIGARSSEQRSLSRPSAATVRRKGVISGTLDTGLNAMPLVGALKNGIEILRGRDFFPDRYPER